MATKYEIIEGDTGQWISSWNSLSDAAQECDRLNATFNGDYFVQKVVDGVIYR